MEFRKLNSNLGLKPLFYGQLIENPHTMGNHDPHESIEAGGGEIRKRTKKNHKPNEFGMASVTNRYNCSPEQLIALSHLYSDFLFTQFFWESIPCALIIITS